MKKFLIRSTVFLLTFVITLMVASRLLNKGHDNLTMEMGRASLPIITMLWNNVEYNSLYGHASPMDPAYQRDHVTFLGENRKTDFKIDTYGREVTAITASVRSGDGTRLIETMEIQPRQKNNDEIVAELALKDLIEQNQEYVVSIELTMDGWQQAFYYVRVIWNPDSMVGEQIAFVKDFHEKLYHREEAKALVKYLESNSKLEDNSSFHQVNIHSSFKQITWGDLKVSEVRSPRVTVKESYGQNASLILDFEVSTKGSERDVRYRVQEFYKIKYAPDRTYLLGYERTMTQIPDEKALTGGDKLLLGIGDVNVDMMENEDGSVVVFQQADRLFSYQVKDQKLVQIFSFYDLDREDAREELDQHDVKIFSVDQDGNVDFAVWGYQNRGEREGEVGIRICRYDAKINSISEMAFIPWDRPYSDLKTQLRELFYVNGEQVLTLYLERGIYQINLSDQSHEKVLELPDDGCMLASSDHQIVAWQVLGANGYSNEIKLRDLEEEAEVVLRGNQGEALRILGYMGQDVIYGTARVDQIVQNAMGQEFFPMYKISIARADGTILKDYEQEGIFVTGCSVEENQIILDRSVQREDESFVATTQDHVTKTTQAKAGKNQISVVDIDVYEKYVQIKVNGKIDSKKVQLLTPKEVATEGNEELTLEIAAPAECYRVYGPKGYEGSFSSVRNALLRADEISGSVLDQGGNLLWRKGDRSSRNQIMAIREPEKVTTEESLAVCLDVMLKQKGISVSAAELLERGKTPVQILSENVNDSLIMELTGNSLEAMLYFVSRDLPVLALLKDGEAILITGYNESQVVIFQPSAGKLAKRSMSDAGKWFEESGNCFLTYE